MAVSARPVSEADPVAPLGVPTILLAVAMLCAPVALIGRLPGWSDEYGGMIYVVLMLYVVTALWLLWWGVTVRRTGRRRRRG